MTTPADAQARSTGLTALSVLQQSPARGIGAGLSEVQVLDRSRDALTAVDHSLWASAQEDLGGMAEEFLDIDIGNLVISGWRKWRDLVEAADRTRTDDTREEVPLAAHEIVLHQKPDVDLVLGTQVIATLHFDVCVTITVEGVVGSVRHGRLMALHGGECTVKISLEIDGQDVTSGQKSFDPHLLVTLGDGLEIAPRDD